jgi:hypothetical protein
MRELWLVQYWLGMKKPKGWTSGWMIGERGDWKTYKEISKRDLRVGNDEEQNM